MLDETPCGLNGGLLLQYVGLLGFLTAESGELGPLAKFFDFRSVIVSQITSFEYFI